MDESLSPRRILSASKMLATLCSFSLISVSNPLFTHKNVMNRCQNPVGDNASSDCTNYVPIFKQIKFESTNKFVMDKRLPHSETMGSQPFDASLSTVATTTKSHRQEHWEFLNHHLSTYDPRN
jgi:hypothetical protein